MLRSALETHLPPYFRGAYRPLNKGDTFKAGSTPDCNAFEVTQIASSGYEIVAKNTIIYYNVD